MERKQLNFSAPLMSARRYSSPSRSSCDDHRRVSSVANPNSVSCQKTNLHSAEHQPVNPGSVPFMWEKTPGKPKGMRQLDHAIPVELPKLPPGRTSKSGELPGFRNPNKFSGELNGKISGEIVKTLTTLNRFNSMNEGMVRWVTSEKEMLTEMSATSESRDDPDDDATFSTNAHDSNSQPGSFSVNCSVSGLSGSEQQNGPKPCSTETMMSTDRKSRDLMMARFLPAAKAMTLEPPQYASRKQQQQQQQLPVWVPHTPVLKPNMCKVVAYKGQDVGLEKSEEDDSSYDDKSIVSVKVKACGFLPEIFSKKSLCLLNRLPSLKNRSKSALSSASSKVSSLAKTSSWKSFSAKPNKPEPRNNNQKQKQNQVFKSCELQKPQHTSRPMFYSGELQTTTARSRSGSPYRSASRRSSSSPYRSVSPNPARPTPPQRVSPNEQTRSKTPQKSRIVQVPKSETAFRYGGRLEAMRTRGLSGPLVCGANVKDDLAGAVKSGFTPPLPKSPSESWLSRKVSPRRSASNPSLNSKPHPTSKQSVQDPGDAKWETIVKSSHSRRDLGWYSGELVTHAPQRP